LHRPPSLHALSLHDALPIWKCRVNSKGSPTTDKTLPPAPTSNPLVIKEKFKATNIGRMTMQIRSFLIDGTACESHGFHVKHCERSEEHTSELQSRFELVCRL